MSKSDLDETLEATLKYDASGLIPVIVCDTSTNELLMFAWMNSEALEKTQRTGLAHFYSRSRGRLWLKGETSGETFAVDEIRVDCDQDVLQLRVTGQGKGNACHTGRRSCFYRKLENGKLAFVKT